MNQKATRIFSHVLVQRLTNATPENPFNRNPNERNSFVFKQVVGESEKGSFIGFNVKSIHQQNEGYTVVIEEQPFKRNGNIYLVSIWRGDITLIKKVYEFKKGYMIPFKDYQDNKKVTALAELLYTDISDFINHQMKVMKNQKDQIDFADKKYNKEKLNDELMEFICFIDNAS